MRARTAETEFTRRRRRVDVTFPAAQLLMSAAFEPKVESALKSWHIFERYSGPLPDGAWSLFPRIYLRFGSQISSPTLQSAFVDTWATNLRVLQQFWAASEVLESAHIPMLVLKGGALISDQYCDDVSDRPFVDVDVLVNPDQFVPAVRILESHGWRFNGNSSDAQLAAHHSINLSRSSIGSVDLHREPLRRSRSPDEDSRLWARSIETKASGRHIRVPCLADMVTICLGHAWVGDLKSVADLGILLPLCAPEDFAQIGTNLEKRRLTLHSQRVLRFAETVGLATSGLSASIEVHKSSRWDRILDRLEYTESNREGFHKWIRQYVYFVQRTGGLAIAEKISAARYFALFETQESNLRGAAKVALRAAIHGGRPVKKGRN